MMPNPPAADRVLILRLGAMGDVIRTLPAVAALRSVYPGAHLTWVVEPSSAGVVTASGLVDEVLIFPRPRLVEAMRDGDPLGFARRMGRFVQTLRDRRFEIAIDFHGLLKSGLLARLSGAALRIGFGVPAAREFSSVFSNHRVMAPKSALSRFDRNAALVSAIAPEAEFPTRPLLGASALAKARLSARLRATGRERSRDFVLLHPGSSIGAIHKRYSLRGWAAVAKSLEACGLEVWVACGPDRHERSMTEEIVRLAEGALVLAPETRSFDDLLALQSRAAVFVACDSGPLHAASLGGIPVVQLLGPTDPDQNAPWRDSPSARLYVPPTCSPCRRGCGDPTCMRSIPPEAVAETTRKLLATMAGQGTQRTGSAQALNTQSPNADALSGPEGSVVATDAERLPRPGR